MRKPMKSVELCTIGTQEQLNTVYLDVIHLYSLAYGPYSLTSASFRMIAHAVLPSALFLRLFKTVRFQIILNKM
jgi:hypothetical protein